MKRISTLTGLALTAAIGLSACVSQPHKAPASESANASEQPRTDYVYSTAQREPGRAYREDYEKVLSKAPPRGRKAVVLGARQDDSLD